MFFLFVIDDKEYEAPHDDHEDRLLVGELTENVDNGGEKNKGHRDHSRDRCKEIIVILHTYFVGTFSKSRSTRSSFAAVMIRGTRISSA